MSKTSIEWTDKTWNCTRGCSRVSPGCGGGTPHLDGAGGCYAERQAYRFAGPGMPYEGLVALGKNGPRWTGKVRLVPEMLAAPLGWKRPCRVFVNSMSDLFHEGLSNEEIAAVFGVMAAAPRHTFQVLTKRAERMRAWFDWAMDAAARANAGRGMTPVGLCLVHAQREFPGDVHSTLLHTDPILARSWPLSNCWIGVSVEDQRRADERIPHLLAVPAAVRFLSVEPQLGPVSLDRWFGLEPGKASAPCLCSEIDPSDRPCLTCDGRQVLGAKSGLHWVVQGGESGPGARPFDLDWARSLRDQCKAAGRAYFFKQAGAAAVDEISDTGRTLVGASKASRYSAAERLDNGRVRVRLNLADRKGGNLSELPAEFNVRQFPEARS